MEAKKETEMASSTLSTRPLPGDWHLSVVQSTNHSYFLLLQISNELVVTVLGCEKSPDVLITEMNRRADHKWKNYHDYSEYLANQQAARQR